MRVFSAGLLNNEAAKETKFGKKVAWMRMMPSVKYTHSTEKARDITLDDENASQVTCVAVTALDRQPARSFSDLGDDQSTCFILCRPIIICCTVEHRIARDQEP